MNFKSFVMFVFLISTMFITGYWDAKEITHYTLVSLVGLDKTYEETIFYMEYNDPNMESSDTNF